MSFCTNDYDYVSADAVNATDLDGKWCRSWRCLRAKAMPVLKKLGRSVARGVRAYARGHYRIYNWTGRNVVRPFLAFQVAVLTFNASFNIGLRTGAAMGGVPGALAGGAVGGAFGLWAGGRTYRWANRQLARVPVLR